MFLILNRCKNEDLSHSHHIILYTKWNPSFHLIIRSLFLRIVEERPVETGVEVLSDEGQQVLVKLENVGVVLHDLPDTVQELDKDRRVVLWNVQCTWGAINELSARTLKRITWLKLNWDPSVDLLRLEK